MKGRCMNIVLLLVISLFVYVQGTQFNFAIQSRAEQCFLEHINARGTNNKLLFRVGIINAKPKDFIDVVIRSPSEKIVESWNSTQLAHSSTKVRESGLYQFCFQKVKKSSVVVNVFYSFDFISTGNVAHSMYPNIAATISKATPDIADYGTMTMANDANGVGIKYGVLEYDLYSISPTMIRDKARVQLLLTPEFVAKTEVAVAVAQVRKKLVYPLSWETFENFPKQNDIFDVGVAKLGQHITFDVTDLVVQALKQQKGEIAFVVLCKENEETSASIMGLTHMAMDLFPKLIVEELGVELMQEIAYFKETVFGLRGDIAYILQNEVSSRNAAESANSRVKWLSLLINIVLMGIAFGQVIYIRSMLESGY